MFSLTKRGLAEMVGTALLVLVGPGTAVATFTVQGENSTFTEADLLGIAVAFGLIVAAMVYSIGKVSGCHINPAVTFAFALTRRVPWREVPVYWLAQFVGGVLGALAIWAAFGNGFADVGGGQTYFNEQSTSYLRAFGAEVVGTGILMFTILGIVDSRSPGDLAGLVIGFVIVAIILYLGPITGASINPARSFGPELVTTLVKPSATHWAQFLPVYLLAQLVGAGLAALLYDFLARPSREQMPIEESVTEPTQHGHITAS